jgi:hypothetical protein
MRWGSEVALHVQRDARMTMSLRRELRKKNPSSIVSSVRQTLSK